MYKSLSIIFVLLLSGCTAFEIEEPLDGIDDGSSTISVNGVTRYFEYRLVGESSPALVIAFHGGGESVSSFEVYSKLTEEATETKDFGVIYPEGINSHWNDGRAESGSTADDVSFIRDLISRYRERGYSKFYLIGMSNGGLMVQRMACEMPTELEGIVVVAATQSTYLQTECANDTTALKSMFIFGDSDPIFTSDGNINPDRGTHIGMSSTADYWLARNSCDGIMTLDRTLDVVDDDQTSVDFYRGDGCNMAFKYLDVVGGGHRWPDPSADNGLIITSIAGYATHEISTVKEMVDFFGL